MLAYIYKLHKNFVPLNIEEKHIYNHNAERHIFSRVIGTGHKVKPVHS